MQKPTKSERKLAMREEAKRKIHGPRYDPNHQATFAKDVAKGLNELRSKSAQGGDGAARRIKSELMYLINNYLPRYDMRIEQLIDDWRRSGDPGYDPGVRVKLRQARREHSVKSRPH